MDPAVDRFSVVIIFLRQRGGKSVFRGAVRKHGKNPVLRVVFQIIADLLGHPGGIGGIRRTDHDQVIGGVERVAQALGKIAVQRELIPVAEDLAETLLPVFAQGLRYRIALQQLVQTGSHGDIDRLMPVADKRGVFFHK